MGLSSFDRPVKLSPSLSIFSYALRDREHDISRQTERNNKMRAPKAYVVSVLITICTLLAGGYAQTSNARTVPEAVTGQDVSPKPSNPGGGPATDTLPNSRNNPEQAAPGTAPGLPSPAGQRGTPAIPAADGQNSSMLTAPLQSQAEGLQNALFEFLFNNVSALSQIADSDDKAGNHTLAAAWRTHDQRGAGLNDAEGQILQEIALDCLQALKKQDAKINASAEKDRAQRAPGVIGPTPPELIQLVEDRKKIVSDHIERLREALGDGSFNKLDIYVHSSFHPQVIAPKPASSSTTAIEKSK